MKLSEAITTTKEIEIRRSNDILKLIDAIGNGHHVYSGMVHNTRVIAYLTQALMIADEIEQREYQNAKRIDELNHIVESWQFQYQALCDKYYSEKYKIKQNERFAEIGKATEYVLNCRYGMAIATKEQINCSEGGIYITDVDNLLDLYNGMSIYESEENS